MLKRSMLVAAAALLAVSGAAQAQSSESRVISVNIPTVLYMDLDGDFVFPSVTDAHYEAGSVETSSGPTLVHRGNVPYDITIEGDAATLAFTASAGDDDPDKPVGDLTITEAGGPVAVGAPSSAANLVQRAARGGTVSTALTAALALDWANDPPGAYSTTVTFTMVAN